MLHVGFDLLCDKTLLTNNHSSSSITQARERNHDTARIDLNFYVESLRGGEIMLPAYPQYSDEVSLDEIKQVFLSDRKMYLSGMLNDIFHLQIYHSEEEDAENDECVLLLTVGDDDNSSDKGEVIILNSEAYPLEQIIYYFKLDRTKVMWSVDKDEPRFLSDEELRNMGHTEDEIRQILKNREERKK